MSILAAALSLVLQPQQPPTETSDQLMMALQRGYEDLRVQRTFRLTETYARGAGLNGRTISLTAFWYQGAVNDPGRFELRETEISPGPSRLLRRIVANGGEFAVYNASDNTYSLAKYSESGECPAAFAGLLARASDAPSAPIIKLIGQVFGSDFPVFEPWIAGTCADGDEGAISFGRGGGQLSSSSVVFSLFPLKSVIGHEAGPAGLNAVSTNWSLIIEHVPLTANLGGADFTFVPPKGAERVGLN